MDNEDLSPKWYDDADEDQDESAPIDIYNIVASPNDFNVQTIFDYISKGVIYVPPFQRNYVWDIKRASKFIESLVIGLPIPQIFLYEESRNKFSIIDGQQRLMSIYYFRKSRFPRRDKRAELREIIEVNGGNIPDNILNDNKYFSNFTLNLKSPATTKPNKLDGYTYETMPEDLQGEFNLRPIRCIIIKELTSNSKPAVYEIFNRLNSGGITLKPQEIRLSIDHSPFYEMLLKINRSNKWREIIRLEQPDNNFKDIEFLLRAFAMLNGGKDYKSPMKEFLDGASTTFAKFKAEDVDYLHALFESFLQSLAELPVDIFYNEAKVFSITIFESIFVGVCETFFNKRETVAGKVNSQKLLAFKSSGDAFRDLFPRDGTASKVNVDMRLKGIQKYIELI